MDTPLSRYTFCQSCQDSASALRIDFEEYLNNKLAQARKEGRELYVLDIGIGSGWQWKKFLLENPDVNFIGTTLGDYLLVPEIKPRAILCSAAELHKHLAPDLFDIVVSHYGTHKQEMEALENIVHVLKEGCEAFVSGSGTLEYAPLVELSVFERWFGQWAGM